MALVEILQDPCESSIIGSKDPIVIKLNGENYVLTPPAKTNVQVTFTSIPSNGDTLGYNVNGITGTITFLDSVSTTGLECQTIAGGQSLADWINEKLIPVLRMQPAFDGFDFSVGGPSSILSIYTLENVLSNVSLIHTGYTVSSTTITGSPGEFSPGYSIMLQVQMTYFQEDNIFPIRSQWRYFKPSVVNGEGVVHQDIKEIVDSLFQEIDIPAENNQSAADVYFSARKLRIAFREIYDNAEEIGYVSYSQTCRVVKGGRRFGDSDSAIPVDYPNKFLTLRENVYTDQRIYDWLYFVQPSLEPGEKMWVRTSTLYDDGNWVDRNTLQITSLNEGKITRIPCGFNQLMLHTFSGNPVAYRVDVIRTNSSNVYLENIITSIEFKLYSESDYVCGLQYLNSFGFIEAILLNGYAEFKAKYSRDLEVSRLPLEASRNDHREIGYNISNQYEIDVTTGPISRRSWLAANDIFLSRNLWFVWMQGKNLRSPVQLVNGDAQIPAFSPDGSGVAQLPLTLRFSSEKANSFKYPIIDI